MNIFKKKKNTVIFKTPMEEAEERVKNCTRAKGNTGHFQGYNPIKCSACGACANCGKPHPIDIVNGKNTCKGLKA